LHNRYDNPGKDERGRYQIDPAELERVYGKLRPPDARSDADGDENHGGASSSAMRAAALEREIELIREMWERERSAWDDERAFLRGLVSEQSGQIKLLTDQRSMPATPLPRRPLLARILGRA
jgi:hypothetical protein